MTARQDRLRTTVSLGVTLTMLALSVAVPLLERADIVGTPVVESEHDPASCPPAHDHTVCSQVGANFSAPGSPAAGRASSAFVELTAPVERASAVPALFVESNPSRAPPLA